MKEITWQIDREEELRARFSGSYYIRSSRTDLDEKELWSLYYDAQPAGRFLSLPEKRAGVQGWSIIG